VTAEIIETEDQRQRERAEIERALADSESPRRSRGDLRLVADTSSETPADWMARALKLQSMKPPDVPPSPESLERARVAARFRCLKDAGFNDEDGLDVISRAVTPPVIPGHEGSQRAFAMAERFMDAPRLRDLVLLGPSGTGKTYGGAWVLAATPESLFLQAPAYQCEDDLWRRTYARAMNAKLLVINDLGTEPNTEWLTPRISSLLIDRHDQGKRTILTANMLSISRVEDEARRGQLKSSLGMDDRALDLKTIEGRYGDPLADRLLDARLSIWERCKGESLRRRREA